MKLLIIFPHALGDMVLLTPALKAWCENNEPPSIVVQRRFNSSPFYDMTYDDQINIFDYKIKKDIFYFDHFPIHQYNVANRKVLERKFFRNASSSYFEIIWKKN